MEKQEFPFTIFSLETKAPQTIQLKRQENSEFNFCVQRRDGNTQ